MLAALALALTGACRVDVSVGIEADAEGGGEVRAAARLDGPAVSELVEGSVDADGETDVDAASRIRLDDLRQAGWDVEGPTMQDDGGLEVVATHDFADTDEAEALLADLGGDGGVFRGFALDQDRGFFTTRTELNGTIDLQAGLGAFADAELQAALAGSPEAPLGVTTTQLEQRFGAAIDRLLGLQVQARLPGDIEANAPTEAGPSAVWSPALGQTTVIEATSERWNVANVVLSVVALASGLALAAVLALRRRSQTPAPSAAFRPEQHE